MKEKESEPLPIDRGWAWMVALGASGNLVLSALVNRSLGILFVEILLNFPGDVSTVAWVPAIHFFCFLAISPFVGCFCNVFGFRKAGLLGGLLSAAAIIFASLVDRLELLLLLFGALSGIGFSFGLTSGTGILPLYFNKRCSLANGLIGMGAGLGGVIGPVLFRYLLDSYGLKGCLLIVGGLCLNSLVFTSLFRDINTYKMEQTSLLYEPKRELTKPELKFSFIDLQIHTAGSLVSHYSGKSIEHPKELHTIAKRGFHASDFLLTVNNKRGEQFPNQALKTRSMQTVNQALKTRSMQTVNGSRLYLGPPKRNLTHASSIRSDSPSVVSRPSSYMGNSLLSLATMTLQQVPEAGIYHKKNNTFSCCRRNDDEDSEKGNIFEWSLFRNPVFLLLMIPTGFITLSGPIIGVILPSHCMEHGISAQQVALMAGVAVIPEPITRLLTGWFADLNLVPSIYIFIFSWIMTVVMTFVLPFLKTFPLLMAYSILQSTFSGIMFCINPVVLVHMIGGESLTSSFSTGLMLQGLFFLIAPPAAGMLYDATGSWYAAIYLSGGVSLVACATSIVAALLHRRRVQSKASEELATSSDTNEESDNLEQKGDPTEEIVVEEKLSVV